MPATLFQPQDRCRPAHRVRHADRNAQFEHIGTKVVAARAAGQQVIPVDTKKKEMAGNYKNGGSGYHRSNGDPQRENVRDFINKELGKAVPYGVYDVPANAGFVSVGIASGMAEFAVEAIRTWIHRMRRHAIQPKRCGTERRYLSATLQRRHGLTIILYFAK
jgi:hypothetical protein